MTHWDDIAADYDRLTIQSYCGGRIRIGYPPAVGPADTWKRVPGGASFPSDEDMIGQVQADTGETWTFALQRTHKNDVHALPCQRRLIVGEWLIDLAKPRRLDPAPISPVRGTITSDNRLFLYDWAFVAAFGPDGPMWKSRGLFDADMMSVSLMDNAIACHGRLDWIDPDRFFRLLLDPATGEITGGDAEALEVYT